MVRCPYCPLKFRAKRSLERHIKKKHSDMKIRKRINLEEDKCPICHKKLKNIHGVLTHIRKTKDKKHQVNYETIKKLYKEHVNKKKEKQIEKTAAPKVYKKKKRSIWSKIFGFK